MANFPNVLGNPLLNLAGSQIAVTYTASANQVLGAAANLSVWLKVVTAVGSALTTINLKVSASYDGSAGSYVDLLNTDATKGTNSTNGVQSYTVAANNTYYFRVDCTGIKLSQNVIIQASANAAGGAGDSLVANVVVW